MKKKLTMAERARLMQLKRQYDSAPASKRPDIQKKIDALLGKKSQPNPATHDPVGSVSGTSASESGTPKTNAKDPEPEAQPEDNPFLSTPHAPYCAMAETIPMVKVNNGNSFMTYGAFRKKFPERNIFDLAPDEICIMYINQKKLDKYYEEEPDGTMNDMLAVCARPIPMEYEPVEIVIINGLLYAEAKYDSRIEGHGYEGNSMDEYADANLFNDFHDGVIYYMFRDGMSHDEARAYVDRLYQEEVQRAKTVEEAKESSQPAAKDEKSPTPAKDTKNGGGQKPKSAQKKAPGGNPAKSAPSSKKGNSSRSSDFASMI